MSKPAKIQPTVSILAHAMLVNDTITVTAYHSDGTTHEVGTFSSKEEADQASRKWKQQYLIKP